jgi:hypothetical protein
MLQQWSITGIKRPILYRRVAANARMWRSLLFEVPNNLRLINVRWMHGSQLKGFFRSGLKTTPIHTHSEYRKNIPFVWVKKNAVLLMTLTDGEVTYPEPT